MSLPEIRYCPGTLAEGFTTYSRTCLDKVFFGKKVHHILPYASAGHNEADTEKFIENRKRISISGVQEKLSFILDKNKLRLTEQGERGNYILKPVPKDLQLVTQVPANEHLTMQIASQVYGIQTAENALIFFEDGQPAYITRRFDFKNQAERWGTEDFASLARKTAENAGAGFKYEYAYESIADLIVEHMPAHRIELEKFFKLVLFNYLFSNGDAHLKNFSILESPSGDYTLSPAYDLLNTRLHVNDADFALDDGLFKDDFESESMQRNGWAGRGDFVEFAHRIGIKPKRLPKIMRPFLHEQAKVKELIGRSFLDENTKEVYLEHYRIRLRKLNG